MSARREAATAPTTSWSRRGASFGYHNWGDMRSLALIASGGPVVFDATHSVQLTGPERHSSGGRREFVPCSRARDCGGRCGVSWKAPQRRRRCPTHELVPLGEMRARSKTLKELRTSKRSGLPKMR